MEYAGAHQWSTLGWVQRLYTMFPPGLPGVALLILRASVAIALLVDHYGHRHGFSDWMLAAAIVLSLALCLGFLTPIAAMSGLFLHGMSWLALGLDSAALAATVALDALALALLGPGGYSVDAYRFGRRLVVLPPRP